MTFSTSNALSAREQRRPTPPSGADDELRKEKRGNEEGARRYLMRYSTSSKNNGAWSSLVMTLDWGSRDRRFESGRPD